MAPADPHTPQTGGGGEHAPAVAPVAPIFTQQGDHIAPRLAAASGCGQDGGAHDVAPLAPVVPVVHCTWTRGQMQLKIAGLPRIVGCDPPVVPVAPVLPLAPVEPVAGHGLQATGEMPPRLPKSRAMLVSGLGHPPQPNQATRAEELAVALAPDRHGRRWHRSSGRIRASGIAGEPVAPLEPVEPPAGHGLHSEIVGIDTVEPVEPVEPPPGHGLQTTRRTIRRKRRRIGCPA